MSLYVSGASVSQCRVSLARSAVSMSALYVSERLVTSRYAVVARRKKRNDQPGETRDSG